MTLANLLEETEHAFRISGKDYSECIYDIAYKEYGKELDGVKNTMYDPRLGEDNIGNFIFYLKAKGLL